MLPKRRRLSAAQVREVIARGKSRRGGTLSLKTLENKGHFACAVVVSKKVARSAVERNKIRRRIYSALRTAPLPSTGHMVLFVLSNPAKDAAKTFALDIQKLLHV